jgi:hemerythrin-like domain-containing protein
MKRHPSLRDCRWIIIMHLVQAHRCRKLLDATRNAAIHIRRFRALLARTHGPHFREEEEALLPFFARYGDIDQEPIRQMQREHILIRRDVAALLAMSSADASTRNSTMQALGHNWKRMCGLKNASYFR